MQFEPGDPPRSTGISVRLVITPCSFKESLTASDAAKIMARVARRRRHDVDIVPLADGGEGTLDALCGVRHENECDASSHSRNTAWRGGLHGRPPYAWRVRTSVVQGA